MFDLFLKVKSRRALAMRLNAEGRRTRRGAFWTCGTVTEILRNPVYTGANVYGRRRKNNFRLKDVQAWTVVGGMRSAMVAPETFEAVQALIERGQDGQAEKRAPQTYLLKGLVRCGKCGSAMCGSVLHRGEKVYRYYRCNGSQHRGKFLCSGLAVGADAVGEGRDGPKFAGRRRAHSLRRTHERQTQTSEKRPGGRWTGCGNAQPACSISTNWASWTRRCSRNGWPDCQRSVIDSPPA